MTDAQQTATAEATILDFGKKKRKRVKQLRKGKGPLLEDVKLTIADLKAKGAVPADAHTVIVVVRERPEGPWAGFLPQ